MRILVVCLGNICRSPTAEAALREAVADAGLADRVEIDSAGTGDWHIGHPPDPRMVEAAAADGLALDGKARQMIADDFADTDLVLVMDRQNLRDVLALAPDDEVRAKVRLFREFDPERDGDDVPDPYYGGDDGFGEVVRIVRRAARGVVDDLAAQGV
jgi:protein-tyrosine phosphatase